MKAIGIITVTTVAIIYSILMNGYAFSVLWAWFIAPTFGCVVLSIPAAIGISMTVSYLVHRIDADKKSEEKSWAMKLVEAFAIATLKPGMALLFGFVVKSFM